MKYNVYTVFDCAANGSGPLFQAVNDAVACRQYRQLLKAESITEPDSYKLYRVGNYDSDDMELKPDVNPVEIFTGVE